MPAKGGKHHPHIDPWRGDPADRFFPRIDNLQDRGWGSIDVVEIEKIGIIVIVLILCLAGLVDRESTPMLFDG